MFNRHTLLTAGSRFPADMQVLRLCIFERRQRALFADLARSATRQTPDFITSECRGAGCKWFCTSFVEIFFSSAEVNCWRAGTVTGPPHEEASSSGRGRGGSPRRGGGQAGQARLGLGLDGADRESNLVTSSSMARCSTTARGGFAQRRAEVRGIADAGQNWFLTCSARCSASLKRAVRDAAASACLLGKAFMASAKNAGPSRMSGCGRAALQHLQGSDVVLGRWVGDVGEHHYTTL